MGKNHGPVDVSSPRHHVKSAAAARAGEGQGGGGGDSGEGQGIRLDYLDYFLETIDHDMHRKRIRG